MKAVEIKGLRAFLGRAALGTGGAGHAILLGLAGAGAGEGRA